MDKYAIINESKLLKRIEELEINISICILPEQQNLKNLLEQELEIKKEILLHSTPLIPEIEKAFDAGCMFIASENQTWEQTENKQDYISNLKLDI